MESRQLYVGRRSGRFGRVWRLLPVFAGALAVLPAFAGGAAVVDLVQWPAWSEKAGRRAPLAAGQTLGAGETVITGDGARVQLRLADGSAVKLGEQASLRLARLTTSGSGGSGVLDAGLELARGAFRFTTGLFRGALGQHRLEVRMPTATIGVRGTDFWGKSTPERQWVLLIEGQIDFKPAAVAEASRRLSTPMNYLITENASAWAERRASEAEVGAWANETEAVAGQAAGREREAYVVRLGVSQSRAEADADAARLRGLGYPVEVRAEKRRDGGRAYALIVRGLARADAETLATRLRAALGKTE